MSAAALDVETARLVREFEAARLDAFPHADHVRVAWAHAQTLPLLEAIARMRDGLRRFAAARGAPEKYHETITWAFVVLIHERAARSPGATWAEFARVNADVFDRDLLRRYYRPGTLASPLARSTFVMPDAPGTP